MRNVKKCKKLYLPLAFNDLFASFNIDKLYSQIALNVENIVNYVNCKHFIVI